MLKERQGFGLGLTIKDNNNPGGNTPGGNILPSGNVQLPGTNPGGGDLGITVIGGAPGSDNPGGNNPGGRNTLSASLPLGGLIARRVALPPASTFPLGNIKREANTAMSSRADPGDGSFPPVGRFIEQLLISIPGLDKLAEKSGAQWFGNPEKKSG